MLTLESLLLQFGEALCARGREALAGARTLADVVADVADDLWRRLAAHPPDEVRAALAALAASGDEGQQAADRAAAALPDPLPADQRDTLARVLGAVAVT